MAHKILIVCQSINPDLRQLYEIKRRLRGTSIVFGDDDALGMRFAPQPNRASALFRLDNWLAIAHNLRRVRANGITHVLFDDASPLYLAYGVFLRLLGVGMIYTIHDQRAHNGRGAFAVNLYVWMVSRWFADEIVVFSRCQLTTRAKVHTVWLGGYDGERGEPDMPDNAGLQVLLFGRIREYKGYEHLATIAERTACLPIRYRVIGAGEEKLLRPLAAHANITIENRHVAEHELRGVFAAADINLLPYSSGTQSGVALLAASFGVPTLAFDVGALKAYIDHGIGQTVPAFDHDGMARALREALHLGKEERAAARRATRAAYDRHFSSDAMCKDYAKLLHPLLGMEP